ncbi:hypothetical protein N0V95_000155 [Ascochyta clinopodiicola]|nr:hypothetical protein N0V95_000155 [Ascochyta clinopodiicola]
MTQKPTTLSARENEVLALAWQCFEADPKYIPHILFTTFLNLRNTPPHPSAIPSSNPTSPTIQLTHPPQYTIGSARFTLGKIKTKLKTLSTSTSVSPATTPSSKTKGRVAKKRTADTTGDDESGAPKGKKRAKKAGKAAGFDECDVEAVLGLGEGEEEEVKVKREPEEMWVGADGDGGDDEEEKQV